MSVTQTSAPGMKSQSNAALTDHREKRQWRIVWDEESETDASPRKSSLTWRLRNLFLTAAISASTNGTVSPGKRSLRHGQGAGFDIGRIVSQRIFWQSSPHDGLALADHILRNRLSARLLEADKFFNRRDDHSRTSMARNQNGFDDQPRAGYRPFAAEGLARCKLFISRPPVRELRTYVFYVEMQFRTLRKTSAKRARSLRPA